ncbi:uncharacterized protein BXZ73DRAFT_82059 [Epithele typhae]|uniref:uncharacterized protein n=1 Tax=Epithele typhae TaxID=378194 RepID=UPI0020076972|nr:uncharacterized protein BXZ73DRAFT_82059 [Epithele typhae]KAH9912966.1 hypothetical protein BXZ73DRAFT_82059 [Epithele typhae]
MDSSGSQFPLARAELIALFIESVVFGVFTILCALSVWILFSRERRQARTRLNRILILTSILMWLLSAVHLCLDIQRVTVAFIIENTSPDGPLNFFLRISNPTFLAKMAVYIANTLVGDAFMVFRLYVIWARDVRVVLLPGALILTTAVAGFGAVYKMAVTTGPTSIFDPAFQPWLRAFFILSLIVNLLASGLISARILWASRQLRRDSPAAAAASRWEIVETVVQSAAVYSAVILAVFATYLARTNGQYIALDALQPLIGLTFTLIITRVGLGYTLSDFSARLSAARTGRALSTAGPRRGSPQASRALRSKGASGPPGDDAYAYRGQEFLEGSSGSSALWKERDVDVVSVGGESAV